MNDLILVESQSARNDQLLDFSDERAKEVLVKVDALLHFAQANNQELATTEQVAAFYGVPLKTVKSSFNRHRDEFLSDGVKVFRSKDLRQLKGIMRLSPTTPHFH